MLSYYYGVFLESLPRSVRRQNHTISAQGSSGSVEFSGGFNTHTSSVKNFPSVAETY